ncbi:MAG: peptide-methionine (S)-S-oxide reductase MsrA [Bacteroidetes bacterium]|nr:peptide-methionine (S)-S-oxide reductase MsrA [Bacteroidota bacterium]
MQNTSKKYEIATFGAGCFWCVEAIFQRLDGVVSVLPGYSGGDIENPVYEQVCTGTTEHAEVCQIKYDPGIIKYDELLEVFWKTHDPTTWNRQGADIGPQYRSVIFYHNDEQKQLAYKYMKALDKSGAFDAPILTEIIPYNKIYKAEDYHVNYYNSNNNKPYCIYMIKPKMDKFENIFKDKLKKE